MDAKANELENSYKIIKFFGPSLPTVYRALIFSKWLRSLRYGNDYFKLIDSDSYYTAYNFYIETLLKREDLVISLAVLSDDIDVVLGFSIMQPGVLHYCHVQKDQRNQGIASSLVEPFHTITHVTKIGLAIWNNKLPNVIFNPFS